MTSHRKGPNEGNWSVFAEKVIEERDAAREALASATRMRDHFEKLAAQCDLDYKAVVAERDEAQKKYATERALHEVAQNFATVATAERDYERYQNRLLRSEIEQLTGILAVYRSGTTGDFDRERDEARAQVAALRVAMANAELIEAERNLLKAQAAKLAEALRGLLRQEWLTYEGGLAASGSATVDDLNAARTALAEYEGRKL